MGGPRRNSEFLVNIWRSVQLVWRAHRMYAIAMVVITISLGIIPAAQLFAGKLLVDAIIGLSTNVAKHEPYLIALSLVLLQIVLMFASGVLSALRSSCHSLLGVTIRHNIQQQILRKAGNMPLSAFEDSEFHDRMQNAYDEASSRPLEVTFQLSSIIQSGITVVSFVFILLRLSNWVLLILTVTSLPSFLIQSRLGSLTYWVMRGRTPESRKQGYISNLLRSDWLAKEIKLFALENYLFGLFTGLFDIIFDQERDLARKRTLGATVASMLSCIGIFAALAVTIRLTIVQHLTIGTFTMYLGAVNQFQAQASAILGQLSGVFSNILFISNIFEFMQMRNPSPDGCVEWSGPVESIEFRDVWFQYPGTERIVLREISFIARKGQVVAIVGPNGAGKTTLVKLICGFYRPTRGKILFSGRDTAPYSCRSLQRAVSAVFQEYGRYEFTARDNIAFGQIEFRDDTRRIYNALASAHATKMPELWRDGIETQLGRLFSGGQQLSGGQWQKIALARAYFRDASVLVLDEPTASLDVDSEAQVYREVQEVMHSRVIVLISHRFSTVRIAQQILVLEGGRLTERGNHDELMIRSGYYRTHFEIQAASYR